MYYVYSDIYYVESIMIRLDHSSSLQVMIKYCLYVTKGYVAEEMSWIRTAEHSGDNRK